MRGARLMKVRLRLLLSNHGGRQLDGVSATIKVPPEIAAAVGTQTEIPIDGGIRHGATL